MTAAEGELAQRAPGRGRLSAETLGAGLAAAVAALIVATRLASLARAPEPWLDEAMLSLNLLVIDWPGVLRPLPLFEQAAPLGYVALGKAAVDLAQDHFVMIMRMAGVLASLAAAAVYFRTLRSARPAAEAALTTGLLMLSPALVYFSVEIKHYVFDVLATVVVAAAGMNTARARADAKSLAGFVLASAAASLFSFTAVLIAAGFGSALFLSAALGDAELKPRLRAIILAGLVLALLQAAIYFGYAKPAVAIQLEGYAHKYTAGHLSLAPFGGTEQEKWAGFVRSMRKAYHMREFFRANFLFVGVCGLGWVVGMTSASRMTRVFCAGAALAVAAVLAGSVLGVFTPKSMRHMLFLAPLTAPMVVLGLRSLADGAARFLPAAHRTPARAVAAAAAVLLYGGQAVVVSVQTEREPIKPLLDRAVQEGAWPSHTWLNYASQPTADLLSFPRAPAYLGRIPHASSPRSWVDGVPETEASDLAQAAAGREEFYVLVTHSRPARRARLVAAAERAVGPCRALAETHGRYGKGVLYRCAKASA